MSKLGAIKLEFYDSCHTEIEYAQLCAVYWIMHTVHCPTEATSVVNSIVNDIYCKL